MITWMWRSLSADFFFVSFTVCVSNEQLNSSQGVSLSLTGLKWVGSYECLWNHRPQKWWVTRVLLNNNFQRILSILHRCWKGKVGWDCDSVKTATEKPKWMMSTSVSWSWSWESPKLLSCATLSMVGRPCSENDLFTVMFQFLWPSSYWLSSDYNE